MRPRGESISSPQSTYVGQVGRQKPQWTQSSSRFSDGGGSASKAGRGAWSPRPGTRPPGAPSAGGVGDDVGSTAAWADASPGGVVWLVIQIPPTKRPGASRCCGSNWSFTRRISARPGTGPHASSADRTDGGAWSTTVLTSTVTAGRSARTAAIASGAASAGAPAGGRAL